MNETLLGVAKVVVFVAVGLALTFFVMSWLTDGQPNCHSDPNYGYSCEP